MTTTTDAIPKVDDLRTQGVAILRRLVGRNNADFHPGQWEAIEALVAHHRRALVVQRTGWGKSAVYFVATLLQRAIGSGPTLIVSPLIALMRDQVAAAKRAGVRAAAISSANATEWSEIAQRLDADELDVLLVSPERLVNPTFASRQLPELIKRMGMLVIDEAHCISDWGTIFAPITDASVTSSLPYRLRSQYLRQRRPQTHVWSKMWPSRLPPAPMMCSSFVGR